MTCFNPHPNEVSVRPSAGGWWRVCALAVMLSGCLGCSDILDEVPDNRTEIDTPEKVAQLMTSAYPVESPAVLCELSADNLVDNNALLPSAHLSPYKTFHEEAYEWRDIVDCERGDADTPYAVWEQYYYGVAVCNHALRAIDQMEEADPSLKSRLECYRGEALVTRAYLHFVLVNVFAREWQNREVSSRQPGIPYVTEPEEVVTRDYERLSVDSVYRLVERDLLAGMPLIDDAAYAAPKFHFNLNAARAFAARYYLYRREWRKAEQYATAAIGLNPSGMMRKWGSVGSSSTVESKQAWWNDEKANCNLLLQTTFSVQSRMLRSCRYMNNGQPSAAHSYGSGPTWQTLLPCYTGNLYIWKSQDYGVWHFRVYEYFEYTDKISGIGIIHTVYLPFSAEETLLCRAEARLYQDNLQGCLDDLEVWSRSKLCTEPLTRQRIDTFYGAHPAGIVSDFSIDRMGWDAADVHRATTHKTVLDCILHFRRIETMYEGLRWFDVKRYGIAVYHAMRGPSASLVRHDSLMWDDARRALQLPREVIDAGLEANKR